MTPSQKPWALVVPVKRLDVAKTRLLVAPEDRVELALAMAADTVAACLAADLVESVVVVTDDKRASAVMTALGAVVVADVPDAGLNPALLHGASHASVSAHIAAVASDLPALRPGDLDLILAASASHEVALVADAAGSGTTLLAAGDPGRFRPQFGVASRAAHVDAGAIDLTRDAPRSLRRDVDTVEDLVEALTLGCGPATTRAANDIALPTVR